MSKFSNVPVEDDTAILFSLECKLGEMDILYQKWFCGGINAESFIFVDDDVASMSDQELEKEARTSPTVDSASSVTIGRSDSGFTFVNFNFVVDDNGGDDYVPEVLTADELEQKQMQTRAAIGAKNRITVDRLKKLNTST